LSGHYYFRAMHNTDSGLMAMIQLLNIMSATDATLSSLIAPIHRYAASGEINYRVSDAKAVTEKVRQHYAAQNAKMDDLDGLTVELPDWWFNLRSSNTEPLLRLNLEAKRRKSETRTWPKCKAYWGAEPAKGH
jgi:phosphomannomutase